MSSVDLLLGAAGLADAAGHAWIWGLKCLPFDPREERSVGKEGGIAPCGFQPLESELLLSQTAASGLFFPRLCLSYLCCLC